MNNPQVFKQGEQLVLDSREVAEMVGKRHDHLLRDIATQLNIWGSNDPKVSG